MVSLQSKILEKVHDLRANVVSALRADASSSSMLESGTLTPDEFVIAGDALCAAAPQWRWAAGDPAKAKAALPASQQYLVHRDVRQGQRLREMESCVAAERLVDMSAEGGFTSWVEPSLNTEAHVDLTGTAASSAAACSAAPAPATAAAVAQADDADEDEFADLTQFADSGSLLRDPVAVAPQAMALEAPEVMQSGVRYEMSVTFDAYYRTPRVYLRAFDSQQRPLPPSRILEDVHEDLTKRWGATATIEHHPHIADAVCVSIHPCRHGAAMKRIFDDLVEGGEDPASIRAQRYMFVFLKIIASAVPGLDYDSTFSVKAKGSS